MQAVRAAAERVRSVPHQHAVLKPLAQDTHSTGDSNDGVGLDLGRGR